MDEQFSLLYHSVMTKKNHTPGYTLDLFSESEEPSGLLEILLDESESLFAKKLSLNDRDWARHSNKHQGGVYVHVEQRDSDFFPRLSKKTREKDDAAEIREAFVDIEWPTVRENKTARLVNYRSKKEETHLTRLPKPPFRDAAPASLLIIGKRDGRYRAMVVDSDSDEYEFVHNVLSLAPDFVSGIFVLSFIRKEREEKAVSFIDEVVRAFFDGSFPAFVLRYSHMPTTVELAQTARRQYLTQNDLPNLNPYKMDKPGDALRTISRHVEYEIFKDLQIKIRSIELIRIILGDDPAKVDIEKALRAIVLNFSKIDAMLLSAAQQRKSRAGYSFEHHIEMMMKDGGIPFDKQVVLEAKKRPDFILPSQVLYEDAKRTHAETLVLSAKTTLRERWKQVGGEIRNCDLFLATVDENIAQNAIRDMKSQGISLVVPESLKNSNMTDYGSEPNVLSFRTFFDDEICEKRGALWRNRGYLK